MAKRKSLMDALSEYQKENKSGPHAEGAVKGKGPVRDGKTYGKLLKKNKEEDKGGPKGVLAPKKPTTTSSGGGTNKPKSGSGSSSSSTSTPSKARQQATVTRDNRNKTEAGGMRNTGGRGGTPTPPETRTVRNRRGRVVGTEVVLPKSDKPKKRVNRRGRRIK